MSVCMYMRVDVHMGMRVCMYVITARVYECMCTSVHGCVYVYEGVCMSVYMYECVCDKCVYI